MLKHIVNYVNLFRNVTFGNPLNMGMLSKEISPDLGIAMETSQTVGKSGRDSQQNMIWTSIQERGAPLMCDTVRSFFCFMCFPEYKRGIPRIV